MRQTLEMVGHAGRRTLSRSARFGGIYVKRSGRESNPRPLHCETADSGAPFWLFSPRNIEILTAPTAIASRCIQLQFFSGNCLIAEMRNRSLRSIGQAFGRGPGTGPRGGRAVPRFPKRGRGPALKVITYNLLLVAVLRQVFYRATPVPFTVFYSAPSRSLPSGSQPSGSTPATANFTFGCSVAGSTMAIDSV